MMVIAIAATLGGVRRTRFQPIGQENIACLAKFPLNDQLPDH